MSVRHWFGQHLESAIGPERTRQVRRLERRVRNGAARRLEMPAAPPRRTEPRRPSAESGWRPAAPMVDHPTPPMSRHEFLAAVHGTLQPRTYLEIGVNDGSSLTLSRARSIGVDPAFKVVREVECDLQLVRATSDDFFAREDAARHLDGVPVDLAFIDGMHLSEFALRDFINIEPLMARTGVVVFDDVLPRNALEAARERQTNAWTGDVYKAVEVLLRRRPDLVVLLVNTSPTGTAVAVSLDPSSHTLRDCYHHELEVLSTPDPQSPPPAFMDRSVAVDPEQLLASPVWEGLLARRGDESADLTPLWDELRHLGRA